jgi:hypothetical protein
MTRTSPVTAHDLDALVVAVVAGQEVTRGQLSAAFALVADATNWKLPVDTTLAHGVAAATGLGVLREAVIFFTGSVPTFEHEANGMRVRARGYYAAVGA